MNDLDYKKLLFLFENSNLEYLSYKNNNSIINLKKGSPIDKSNSSDEIACSKANLVPYFIRSKYVCQIITYNTELSRPFIELNQYVKKGDSIGLLLYLNLTINLTAPVSGIISEIRVKNNQMVEYGQVMIVILQSEKL